MFKKWFVCKARTGEDLSKYHTVLFRGIGDNPVRVYIRNRTGENSKRVDFSVRSEESKVEVGG